MKSSPPDRARRRLLARTGGTALAGVALGAMAPVAPAAPVQAQPEPAAPAPASRGYQDSERNRRYYRLARF